MSCSYKGKKVILVWNELQKVSATQYGVVNFGKEAFVVVVSKNPIKRKKHIGRKKAIIYNR